MIEIFEDSQSDIVEIRISGIVTAKAIGAAAPQLERIIEERRPLRLQVDLIGLERFEPDALWEELKFQLGHRDAFGRIAFLVHSSSERFAATLGEFLVSGESHIFKEDEKAQATAWLLKA